MNGLKLSILVCITTLTASTAYGAAAVTPSFVAAIEQANLSLTNKPHSAVFDPECDDAKVRKTRVMKDDYGKTIKDIERSYVGSVGFIYRGDENSNDGVASSFVVGKRQMATVNHAFADNGKLKNPGEPYWVYVEACKKKYPVKDVIYETLFNGKRYLDYALMEFETDLCKEATPLKVGAPSVEQLRNVDLVVTGYLKPSVAKKLNSENGSGEWTDGDFKVDDEPFYQYSSDNSKRGKVKSTSYGRVKEALDVEGQRMDKYTLSQTYGWSGGPIIAIINGEPVVVGMQVSHPKKVVKQSDRDVNYNYSMSPSGGFLEFLKSNVTDLKVWEPSSDSDELSLKFSNIGTDT